MTALPIAAALLLAYGLGHFNFSPLWVLFLVALRMYSLRREEGRLNRIQRNELFMALESEHAMRAFLKDTNFPSWLSLPDTDRLDGVLGLLSCRLA